MEQLCPFMKTLLNLLIFKVLQIFHPLFFIPPGSMCCGDLWWSRPPWPRLQRGRWVISSLCVRSTDNGITIMGWKVAALRDRFTFFQVSLQTNMSPRVHGKSAGRCKCCPYCVSRTVEEDTKREFNIKKVVTLEDHLVLLTQTAQASYQLQLNFRMHFCCR